MQSSFLQPYQSYGWLPNRNFQFGFFLVIIIIIITVFVFWVCFFVVVAVVLLANCGLSVVIERKI